MKDRKYIISAILISSLCIVGSHVFASDNLQSDTDNIQSTMDNLKRQAEQDYYKVLAEVNNVNPDSSVSKFGMSVAKKRFENVVFLGDSITEYLRTEGILNADSVLAKKGEHLYQAKQHIEELKKIKPAKVVILYGANDLSSDFQATYEDNYVNLVEEIKKNVPNIKVYLQAPLPVYEKYSMSRNKNINNNNIKIMDEIVKKVARKTKSTYLTSRDLDTSPKMYEPDGIHFKYDFYKDWLSHLSNEL